MCLCQRLPMSILLVMKIISLNLICFKKGIAEPRALKRHFKCFFIKLVILIYRLLHIVTSASKMCRQRLRNCRQKCCCVSPLGSIFFSKILPFMLQLHKIFGLSAMNYFIFFLSLVLCYPCIILQVFVQ